LEATRRRAAFKAMMRLLEEGAPDQETIAHLAAPLSGIEFLQVGCRDLLSA
jgi:hypothetical protein